MKIEPALLISLIALLASCIFSFANWKRAEKRDVKSDSTQLTTVIVKLENISAGIAEIKGDMNSVKTDVKELRERNAKVESSAASAHKRLDIIEPLIRGWPKTEDKKE